MQVQVVSNIGLFFLIFLINHYSYSGYLVYDEGPHLLLGCLTTSRSLLPFPDITLCKYKERKMENYARKSATSLHYPLSFIHSSRVLPLPSLIRGQRKMWAAFCVAPRSHRSSCLLPMSFCHASLNGPLSVMMYVSPFTNIGLKYIKVMPSCTIAG